MVADSGRVTQRERLNGVEKEIGRSAACSDAIASASGPSPAEASALALVGPGVLDHVEHFLGNVFQRVYHLADRMREADAVTAAEVADTARRLEEFLRVFLDYLSPPETRRISVLAAEVAESIAGQLRDNVVAPVRASGRGMETVRVMVDPGCLSRALQLLASLWTAGRDRDECLRLEFAVGGVPARLTATLSFPPRLPVRPSSEAALQWLAAQRLVEAQGGSLRESAGESGGPAWAIELPLQS